MLQNSKRIEVPQFSEIGITDFARGQSVWRNDRANTEVIFTRGLGCVRLCRPGIAHAVGIAVVGIVL